MLYEKYEVYLEEILPNQWYWELYGINEDSRTLINNSKALGWPSHPTRESAIQTATKVRDNYIRRENSKEVIEI